MQVDLMGSLWREIQDMQLYNLHVRPTFKFSTFSKMNVL